MHPMGAGGEKSGFHRNGKEEENLGDRRAAISKANLQEVRTDSRVENRAWKGTGGDQEEGGLSMRMENQCPTS